MVFGLHFATMSSRSVVLLGAALAMFACSATKASVARPRTLTTIDVPTDEFAARDQHGQPVSLSAALARGVTVLVFYRGHW